MTSRVGAKGQIVIPKEIRDQVHLNPGDDVAVELRDEEIVVVPLGRRELLGGRFRGSGMAARLLEDRAREPR